MKQPTEDQLPPKSGETYAYERLLGFYKKRNNDHDCGRRFIGAVIMYQAFTGKKTVPLSQKLRKDAGESE